MSEINPIQSKPERAVRRIEAAARLGISLATIDRWVREGRIKSPARINNGSSFWPESYLDDLIHQAFNTK